LCDIVRLHPEVHGMHDPTEGGIWNAITELSLAADLGIMVQETSIPVLPDGKLICDHFGLDPLGVIASGSLLVAIGSAGSSALCAAFASSGIVAAEIGYFTAATKAVMVQGAEGIRRLHSQAQDEIVKILT
jgi:hydrogenase maturation factor